LNERLQGLSYLFINSKANNGISNQMLMNTMHKVLKVACAFLGLIYMQTPIVANGTNRIQVKCDHPRLLLSEGEETLIREKIEADPFLRSVHEAIVRQSEAMLQAPQLERIKIGKRLLAVSRNALKQIYSLAYSWRMTGDERYARRAEKVMLDVCAFSDWNPVHYLDVAEMTAAVSIGYDWLYDWLEEPSRSVIREAIRTKGLLPSLPETAESPAHYNWLEKNNNWNAVCNMGMAFGAIALFETDPDLCGRIIARSIESARGHTLQEYSPDGNYPEGYMYWNYGTAFLIMLSDAVEKATGKKLGLEQDRGFMRSAQYMAHMTTQDFGCFAYSDCNVRENALCLPLFWFAARENDPSLLYGEADRIRHLQRHGKEERIYTSRYLPSVMIWAAKNSLAETRPPHERLFVGQGETPVALMRNHWGGPDELFAGLKAGSCKGGHSHMDIGSFVMYMGKNQWAKDLGNQDYYSLEKHGILLKEKSQYSTRWIPFRLSMYSHNLIIFSDSLQRVAAHAKIDDYGDKPGHVFAVSDLTSVQGGLVANYRRGVAIVDDAYVVVRDEITATTHPTPLRWAMLTPAEVEIMNDTTAVLSQNGERLYLSVTGGSVKLTTWSTTSPNTFDAPNPGTIMVGFESILKPSEKVAFTICLIPEKQYGKSRKEIAPIDAW